MLPALISIDPVFNYPSLKDLKAWADCRSHAGSPVTSDGKKDATHHPVTVMTHLYFTPEGGGEMTKENVEEVGALPPPGKERRFGCGDVAAPKMTTRDRVFRIKGHLRP